MSVTYQSKLVVGVSLKKLLTAKEETIETKKYNPDTGEPYTKIETVVKITFIGKEFTTKPGSVCWELNDYLDGLEGLEVHSPYSESSYHLGSRVVGIAVCETNKSEVKEIDEASIAKAKSDVAKRLGEFGFTETDLIRLYSVIYIG